MKIHYAKVILLFILAICLININACQECVKKPIQDIVREETEKAVKQAEEKIKADIQKQAEEKAKKKKDFIIKVIFILVIVIAAAVLFRYGIRRIRKNPNRRNR